MNIKRYLAVGLITALAVGSAPTARGESPEPSPAIAAALSVAAKAVAYAAEDGGGGDALVAPSAPDPPQPKEDPPGKSKQPPGDNGKAPKKDKPEPAGHAKEDSDRKAGRERAAEAIAQARRSRQEVLDAFVAGSPPAALEAEPGMGPALQAMVNAFNTLTGFEAWNSPG